MVKFYFKFYVKILAYSPMRKFEKISRFEQAVKRTKCFFTSIVAICLEEWRIWTRNVEMRNDSK